VPVDDSQAAARPAQLVRTISREGGVAVRTLIGSELVAEAMSRCSLAPTAANALGRALMGAVLVAVGSDDAPEEEGGGETLQLQLRGDGPLGSVVAISDARGRVRGTVAQPATDLLDASGRPDVARAIGLGTLTVVRHHPGWREPYTGTVPLVSGEIAKDITLYLTESEQTPSAMGLGVTMTPDESAVAAAGFLVQILPGASDEEVEHVEHNVQGMPKLSSLALSSTSCDELIDMLLGDLGSRERHHSAPVYFCPCSRERALRTLQLLGRSELREMVEEKRSQEVRCQFCGRAYEFSTNEIGSVMPDA